MQSFLPNETGQKKSSKSPRFLNIKINSDLVSEYKFIIQQPGHKHKQLKGMFQGILYGADANSLLEPTACINSDLVSEYRFIIQQPGHKHKQLKGMFQGILYGADANSFDSL
jgi:hypothetical protein